jgi:hypothetical protein
MQIGTYQISPPLALAPMAGVTDKPFRMLCKQLGAGLAVSEMTHSDPRLWKTRKSQQRMDHVGEPDPISVQIAGTEPWQLAEAARFNVDHGAQIIDINMGCPAKKVCHAWAGSALMRDEVLVGKILEAAVAMALPWRGLPKRVGLPRSRCMDALAKIYIKARPSTTPSPRFVLRFRFRCGSMATSTVHKKPPK